MLKNPGNPMLMNDTIPFIPQNWRVGKVTYGSRITTNCVVSTPMHTRLASAKVSLHHGLEPVNVLRVLDEVMSVPVGGPVRGDGRQVPAEATRIISPAITVGNYTIHGCKSWPEVDLHTGSSISIYWREIISRILSDLLFEWPGLDTAASPPGRHAIAGQDFRAIVLDELPVARHAEF
jgi:hypothetical protein